MPIPTALLTAFPPSADLLLDCVRRHTDDATLMEVAGADYGYKADDRMEELRPIRDDGVIPAQMGFRLAEVLRLTRWCTPEKPDSHPFAPGPTGRSGHFARMFACAVLLRARAEPANEHLDTADDATLAQCLASAKVLGEEFSLAAARFLTWRIPSIALDPDPLWFMLGLLLLAVRLRSGRFADSVLGEVADWVMEAEARFREENPSNPANPMPAPFGVQSGFWQPLAAELSSEAEAIATANIREKLQLCGLLLEQAWFIL
jgi:hypothetical protein